MFFNCFVYLAICGSVGFIVGRLIPRSWINWNEPPWSSFSWECSGRIYDAFHIKRWQNKVPDMSKITKGIMPQKKMHSRKSEDIEIMILETCIAELIHLLLMLMGFGCIGIWDGPGGVIVSIAYFIGNIPYIMIQRYNRPRLIRLLRSDTPKTTVLVSSKTI